MDMYKLDNKGVLNTIFFRTWYQLTVDLKYQGKQTLTKSKKTSRIKAVILIEVDRP